ncbi:hypothetical protein KP509_23G077600 [Ceratopteris richardii]|uniref:Uncharacterized protein n=1 Tax=Ceratopteris richardii TaxID=49495 RepID=A0A8T2S251_CERRI|nr:hypothetical protein KP509_23G077600 [Ceratopteris richardii]
MQNSVSFKKRIVYVCSTLMAVPHVKDLPLVNCNYVYSDE